MHTTSGPLLLLAAAVVAVLHSILPDHWVPLAVVARTQRWTIARVARVSVLASAGHVIASIALAGIIAAIGLRFQHQIDTQQGHIVGGVLVVTGLGFLIWGLTGHRHSHDGDHAHDHGGGHAHGDTAVSSHPFEWAGVYEVPEGDAQLTLEAGPDPTMLIVLLPLAIPVPQSFVAAQKEAATLFQGRALSVAPGEVIQTGSVLQRLLLEGAASFTFPTTRPVTLALFTEHHPEEFAAKVRANGAEIRTTIAQAYPSVHQHGHLDEDTRTPKRATEQQTLGQRLAAIAVPFGIAASPDLTILPVALAASAVGLSLVGGVLLIFAIITMGTFVGLTVLATLAGYQIKGAWIENNANTVTSAVLIAIGIVAFVGF